MVGVMRGDVSDDAIYDAWIAATASLTMTKDNMINSTVYNSIGKKVLMNELPDQGRNNHGRSLGSNAWNKLQKCMTRAEYDVQPIINLDDGDNIETKLRWEDEQRREHVNRNAIYTIDNSIASLSHLNVSPDGTTKLLLKMKSDGLEVESVIIPWMEKGFSTLCVSSQVGCRQGCTFCATGRMGKLRSLTTDEILVQVYFASKVCRIANNISTTRGDAAVSLPKVDNIVFMGMGEPADNAHAVVSAVRTMVDRSMFGLAQSKITISTVAPDPGAFATLGQAPAALAWSVHAVDDALRLKLVPTTKYSMEELRMGLVTALQSRANKLRRTMLEVALIEGVNDSDDDAMRLAEFSQAIMNDVNGSKVVVNLIPYNAIDHPTYRAPSKERVLGFQKIITDGGVLCYVRTTRGDDESAACGQLATRKRKHVDDVVVA